MAWVDHQRVGTSWMGFKNVILAKPQVLRINKREKR
jgi:hypothetical protein